MMGSSQKMAASRQILQRTVKVAFVLVLVLTGMVLPVLDVGASASWRGEYFANMTFDGVPVIRNDAAVNFDWGLGAPAPGIGPDYFSVRWTSSQHFSAGTYTFFVTADDGVRLWINDQLVIDRWHTHVPGIHSASRYLSTGFHRLRVEYFEYTGQASIRLWWQQAASPPPADAWRGEYYNNTGLNGTLALVRYDAHINFDWGHGAPAPGVNADHFSVRWTRNVHLPTSGHYTFYATVDDGVRVWVGNTLVIDRWYPQSRTTHTGTVYLAAGTYPVRVEYFEHTGTAVCIVTWAPTAPAPAPAPLEIIVDDRDPQFIWGGPASGWFGRNTGFRNHLYWTWNSRTQLTNWGKWFPYVPTPGQWEVQVYVASRYFGTKSATYRIHHAGTYHDRVVNQNIYYGQWVSLGTYYFAGGANEYVLLGDNTGEATGTRYVGFDAMKFIYRGAGPAPGPTPTPPPTPGCSITPVLGFGRVYNTHASVRNKIGCATEPEKGVWMAEEFFQGGSMYWRQDMERIYVLYRNGTWTSFPNTWTVGMPEFDPSIIAPPGYYQPIRGFGKVWREQGAVRNSLGWATTQERGFFGSVQPFTGGTMLWSNVRGVLVLYNDGRWARFE